MIDLATKCVIYVITHIKSDRKYVGQTAKKGSQRWREHCNAADGSFEHTYNGQMYIIRSLRKYGVAAFRFEILEQCLRKDLDVREAFWIAELNTLSPNGFNLRSGALGVDGVKIAPEVGQRISVANKNRVKGPEWRAALSRSHTGKVLTPKHCANISKVQLGKKRGPRSKAVKAKISCSLKGKPHSEERKVAIRAGMTEEGRRRTIEAARIAADIRRWTGQKRVLSNETKIKMSIARYRYLESLNK